MFDLRAAVAADLPQVRALLSRYVRETFQMESPVTEAVLERDGLGGRFRIVVALRRQQPEVVGFAAWQASYDLHWGIHGGVVIDLYVVPECRGFGVAPRMLSLVARQIAAEGGTYLAGQGLTTGTRPAQLYQKIAAGFPGVDCILGGKAFRAFSELSLTSVRDFVKNLPRKEWNCLP